MTKKKGLGRGLSALLDEMKERLLPALSQPTYREGLKAILAAERLTPVPD